jgi:hypothetical protein
VSGKVPGEAEKWDDVIRKITSVWTPEVAAEVLAAITKLDLRSSASVGDVPTFDGSKFVPQAVGGGGGLLTVLKKSVNYSVQVGDSGKLLMATAGDVVFTLPLAAEGLVYTFIPWGDATHPTIVRPQAGEHLTALMDTTLANGVGVLSDQGNAGGGGLSIGAFLVVYGTGAGEPYLVAGKNAGTWSTEV